MARTGYTTKTKEHLLLDAGVWYANYNLATKEGSLIGATSDGGTFIAKATYRVIAVDGIKGDIKGMTFVDRWDVNMSVNSIEVTPENLKMALGAAKIETVESITTVTGKLELEDADYLDNVTFVGRLGNGQAVVIQIDNALCVDGLTLDTKDNGNAIVALNFKAHIDGENPEKLPYSISFIK